MNLNAVEYINAPERLPEFKRKIFFRSSLILIVAIVTVAFVTVALIFLYCGDDDFAGSITIPVAYILFLLAVLILSAYRRLKKQTEVYLSYKLVITDQSMERQQSNLSPVTINLNEIKEVKLNGWGNIEIKGSSPQQFIVVSNWLENFEDVKNQLSGRFVFIGKKGNGPLLNLLVLLGLIGTMLAFYITHNKIVIAVTGSIILCVLMWSIYRIQNNATIEKRIKRKAWWAVIVIVSIAASMYFRLFSSI